MTIIDLNALPEKVDANDETLYADILHTLCVARGIDLRFGQGGILDEYHDCPVSEMYPDYLTDHAGNPDMFDAVVMIPRLAMIEYADNDLDYYTNHMSNLAGEYDHVDNDVTKPTKRDDDNEPLCYTCRLLEQFAFEDELIALGNVGRMNLLRAYLNQFMANDQYLLGPTYYNVTYYHVYDLHGDRIGSVQFQGTLSEIRVPLTFESETSGLLELQANYLNSL